MFANDILHRSGKYDKSPHQRQPDGNYNFVYVASRVSRCVGIFVINDLLRSFHVVHLLLLLNLGTCFVLAPLQRPDLLHRRDWSKVLPLSLLGSAIDVLWLYGLTQCGPLRSVLIFENSPMAVLAALAVVFKGGAMPSKVRATVMLAVGFLALVLMDRDISMPFHSEEHRHQWGLNHVFHHMSHYFGLADHKLGVLLLLVALCMSSGQSNATKWTSVSTGVGLKRLSAAVLLGKAMATVPLALVFCIVGWGGASAPAPYTAFESLVMLALAVGFTFVIPFYVDGFCTAHMEQQSMARIGPCVAFASAFALTAWWFPSYKTAVPVDGAAGDYFQTQETVEHRVSGGALLSAVLFAIATIGLTRPDERRGRGGQFIGTDHQGKPLFVYAEDFLKRTSQSVTVFARDALKQILAKSDSRRIFYFLCANLAFCGVEFVYGLWTNSLGLISDGFHMLFDCSALVMGLAASVMAAWTSNKGFSYGYGRVEVLSGFVNALFLVVIACAIFLEALGRLFDPPEIRTERLLFVSVAGLVVNLFGIMAFHGGHGHSHGGDSHGHSHGAAPAPPPPAAAHGHSHGGASEHGHSHAAPAHGHSHGGGANANMQGVFLHVLADTLGSVFVIISTLLISWFGWLWVDPFCSLILAALIFASVMPLLRQSAGVLMQQAPGHLVDELHEALEEVLRIDGVLSYSAAHVWELKSDYVAASLHVQVSAECKQQAMLQRVRSVLRSRLGAESIAVQVEKEHFFRAVGALCPGYEPPPRVARNPNETLMSRAI